VVLRRDEGRGAVVGIAYRVGIGRAFGIACVLGIAHIVGSYRVAALRGGAAGGAVVGVWGGEEYAAGGAG
jgi:hypothetical protein